jgi:hypothetical protein
MYVVFLILLVQFVLVASSFPLTELFSPKPIFHIDAAFHWYQLKLAVNLGHSGYLVGYDPFFNAGYPGGVTFNWSGKFQAAIAWLLSPWLDEIRAYKLVVFSWAVSGPAFIPAAARLLRMEPAVATLAAIFGILMWWASYLHWFQTAGMTSFVFAVYFAIFYFALMLRHLRSDGGQGSVVLLGGLGALGMFIHPLFPLPVAVLGVCSLVSQRNEITYRRLPALLIAVPILSVLPNLVWLLPMVHYMHVFSPGTQDIAPFQKVVDVSIIWKEMFGTYHGYYHGAKIFLPLAVASLWACTGVGAQQCVRTQLARAMTTAGVLLLIFSTTGAIIPALATLQPNRFAPAAYLCLLIPAAIGVVDLSGWVAKASRRAPMWAGIATLGLIGVFGAYALIETARELSRGPVGHYGKAPPVVDGEGKYTRWVLSTLSQRTTDSARVLFETSRARIHDGSHMAGYLAYTSGREFVGGPYPFAFFGGFWDGTVFGKPIAAIGPRVFEEYLNLYNVGWIIAHTPVTKRYLASIPWIVPETEFRELRFYRVNRQASYFIKGSGRVAARAHNLLQLTELGGDEVVLKYHYVPGLKSDPEVELAPQAEMDDPNPFIRIVHPPKGLSIFLPRRP